VLPLDFTWTAPDSCPTQADVVSQLSQAVDADEKDWPALSARAVVEQLGARWRLQLDTEMDGRKGSRLLEADSCEGLARAATLVMALTLGEGLARRQAEAEARAAEPPPAPPAPAPPQPQPAKEPPNRPKAVTHERRAMAWLAPTFGTDPLGAATPGLALGVAWQPSLFRVALLVGAGLPQSTPLGFVDGSLVSHSLHVTLAACSAPTFRPLRLFVCAEAGLTELLVRGRGTARDREPAVPLYGVGPDVGAEWSFTPHAFFRLGVASQFFLRRPELVVEGRAEARKIESVTLTGALGGGVQW